MGFLVNPAFSLDLGYHCQAPPDIVFGAVRKAAQETPGWRSVQIIDEHLTIKSVVRNWRNFGVPIWIKVRGSKSKETIQAHSELHIVWEQAMEPLNYPDLVPFLATFQKNQERLKLNCVGAGTDIGP